MFYAVLFDGKDTSFRGITCLLFEKGVLYVGVFGYDYSINRKHAISSLPQVKLVHQQRNLQCLLPILA